LAFVARLQQSVFCASAERLFVARFASLLPVVVAGVWLLPASCRLRHSDAARSGRVPHAGTGEQAAECNKMLHDHNNFDLLLKVLPVFCCQTLSHLFQLRQLPEQGGWI